MSIIVREKPKKLLSTRRQVKIPPYQGSGIKTGAALSNRCPGQIAGLITFLEKQAESCP